ncbi:hypothetical protein [Shouchella clausii]|uniref:Uncharacterized protein n=1 Tax=Shouchella clausii TaxID=79880 RepID=A0A268NVY7_SHOCL|nr:hypothetical protein [Shouchella clausii]PAE87634.1 hypothetical protein CHH72_17260 [Shouchella clausii]
MSLEGTEKQIAWANDIKKDVLEVFESAKPLLIKKAEDEEDLAELKYYEKLLNEEKRAKFFIDHFGYMFTKTDKAYRDTYLTNLSIVMCKVLRSIAQHDKSNNFVGIVAQDLIGAYEEYKYSDLRQ